MWQTASEGHVPEEALAAGMTKEGEKLYVGRVFHDGTLTPGKVRTWEQCFCCEACLSRRRLLKLLSWRI
jgi:hypothetical protein